jgi:hypothetical protein
MNARPADQLKSLNLFIIYLVKLRANLLERRKRMEVPQIRRLIMGLVMNLVMLIFAW